MSIWIWILIPALAAFLISGCLSQSLPSSAPGGRRLFLILALSLSLLASCSDQAPGVSASPSDPAQDSEFPAPESSISAARLEPAPVPIQVRLDGSLPQPVIDQATAFVKDRAARYNQDWAIDGSGCRVKAGTITAIAHIPTATVGQSERLDLYRLEFRLEIIGDVKKVLTGDMSVEDGLLTEWDRRGQPYLLFHTDENDIITYIADTGTEAIETEFSTPEMLTQYADGYQAAASELYQRYLKEHHDPFEQAEFFHRDGLTLAIPEEYADLLLVEDQGDALFTVRERASVEAAQREEQHSADHPGLLFTIRRYDRASFEQALVSELSGRIWFARDTTSYYSIFSPPDTAPYRGAEVPPSEEDLAVWSELIRLPDLVQEDFRSRNNLEDYNSILLYTGNTYPGAHRYYSFSASGDPEDTYLMVLSQPVRQGEGGIWCVDRIRTPSNSDLLWFPNSGIPAAEFYAHVQDAHDMGQQEDYATPEAAVKTYLRDCGRFPGVTFESLTEVPPLPDLDPLLSGLQDSRFVYSYPGENLDLPALAAALNRLPEQKTEPPEDYPLWLSAATKWRWMLELWLEGTPETVSQNDLHITLFCGPEDEELVELILSKGQLQTITYFRSPELYQMIRHSSDTPVRVDRASYEALKDVLVPVMDKALTDAQSLPGDFSQWKLTRFTPIYRFDECEDGSQEAELYSFDFALKPESPEDIKWAGGMFMDGNLMVYGFNFSGQLAVRYREGKLIASTFMGTDFYFDPDQADYGETREDAEELIGRALDKAENNVGLTVHADYAIYYPLPKNYDNWAEPHNDYPEKVVFYSDRPVDDFRFFEISFSGNGDSYRPSEGRLLYRQEELLPNRPLVIETYFPGDMPTRGFSFLEDGKRRSYALTMSGRDGALMVLPLT